MRLAQESRIEARHLGARNCALSLPGGRFLATDGESSIKIWNPELFLVRTIELPFEATAGLP